jgi:uncharacterized protein
MIPRNYYINQMTAAKDTDLIKIITGIRRCGKSTLLQLFADRLKAEGIPDDHIITVNFEKFEFDSLRRAEALHHYVSEKIRDNAPHYLFIDEVQELECWPRIVNSLRVTFPLDIYITGSNSRVFSGEYLTYITGRYAEIKVYPLSFKEFMTFRGADITQKEAAFNDYLHLGSFPAIALATNPSLRDAIMTGLFDSIFSRDILLRGNIRNEGAFFKVAKFVFDNIGNTLSASAIANTLKSQGHKISVDTVDNYLSLMSNAFVIYPCERYDIRGKERLRTNGKYYLSDLGLRNQLLGYKTGDLGHAVENIVFLEYKRRGYTVYVGKYDDLEIDFIAAKGNEKLYVQVALSAMDDNVLQRETRPFSKISDKFPKLLITADPIDLSQDTFTHLNLYDFLLSDPRQ